MLDNCNYDKIKLLHHLSKIVWYIDKHAKSNSKESGHELCYHMYDDLKKDLEKHIEKLKLAVAGLAKEEKLQ